MAEQEGAPVNSCGDRSEGSKVSDLQHLKRFLMTGTENCFFHPAVRSGTFIPTSLSRMLGAGQGLEAVDAISECNKSGLSTRHECIVFALAYTARFAEDQKVRQAAYKILPEICYNSVHLFAFVCNAEKLKNTTGWGRAQRNAISQWYNSKSTMELAVEVTKYRSRDGWSHKDIIKLAHIKPQNDGVAMMMKYILKGPDAAREVLTKGDTDGLSSVLQYLEAVHAVKCSRDAHQVEVVAGEHKLSIEHIPTWFHNTRQVWRGLMQHMDITDILPHLGRLAAAGDFDASVEDNLVDVLAGRLRNEDAMAHSRLNPLKMYLTMRTYEMGKSDKGKHKWTPNPILTDAMLVAFYSSFKNIAPTQKRFLLAVDMRSGLGQGKVTGLPHAKPLPMAGVIAMCVARSEPSTPCQLVTFGKTVATVRITHQMELHDVLRTLQESTRKSHSQTTECASPILWSKETKKAFDVFLVLTDCDKWSGLVNPLQALTDYQKDMDIPNAKLVVCSLAGKDFTLANDTEPNSYDVIGLGADFLEFMQAVALNTL